MQGLVMLPPILHTLKLACATGHNKQPAGLLFNEK